jgi:hypothetical protein
LSWPRPFATPYARRQLIPLPLARPSIASVDLSLLLS